MQIKRLAALSLAAILATTMLTACPWDKEGGNSVDDSQITADENRPGHTGSDDNDDSDDTSDDDDSKVTITEDENGNKIEKGDGYTRTETPATGSSDGKISYTVTNAAGLVKWASEAPKVKPFPSIPAIGAASQRKWLPFWQPPMRAINPLRIITLAPTK